MLLSVRELNEIKTPGSPEKKRLQEESEGALKALLENDSLYIKEIKKIKIENRRLEAYITKLKLESIKNNTTKIKMADLAEIAKRVNYIILYLRATKQET